jgi:hypothetical protein
MFAMNPAITVVSSMEGWFDAALSEVVRDGRTEVDGATQHYLVSVLAEAHSGVPILDEASARPLPVLLAEAEYKSPAERFQLCRRVGDYILLQHGFFRSKSTRGPEPQYFMTLGEQAYLRASQVFGSVDATARPDPLRKLAIRFQEWAELLHRLALHLLAHSQNEARDLIKVVEHWLSERTPEAERLLRGRGVSLCGAKFQPS